MSVEENYPDIVPYLDNTEPYRNEATEFVIGATRYLLVTQFGEHDSGQAIFEHTPEGWLFIDADNIIDPINRSSFRSFSRDTACGAISSGSQAAVHEHSKDQVDKFSSANGPSGGRLACVWAVRHLIHQRLGYWVTKTDGTAVFDPELRQCFGSTHQEADVDAGGIIISPTEPRPDGGRNIGHVGILGPKTGDGSRLIYSNSSSAAMWKQNFTLDSWIARYRTKKGLRIRFYPLPYRGELLS